MKVRTKIRPLSGSNFVDTQSVIEELIERCGIKASDLKIVSNHRAAYGCPAYQIWEATEAAVAALKEFFDVY